MINDINRILRKICALAETCTDNAELAASLDDIRSDVVKLALAYTPPPKADTPPVATSNSLFKVTNEWLTEFSSDGKGCGYTNKQMAIFGFDKMKPKAWKRDAIGKMITDQDRQQFESGRNLKYQQKRKQV